MAEAHVTPGQIGARLRHHNKNIERVLERAVRAAALRGEAVVVARTPVNTGMTRAAWRVQMVARGADLINDAPHSGALELGTRPHRPPYLPILQWLVQKQGGGIIDSPDQATPEQRGAAWAIVEHIAKHGTRPAYMVRGAMPALGRIMRASIIQYLQHVEA